MGFGLLLCYSNVHAFHLLGCADKDRELSGAQAEIKALKLSERQREKAVEEV